MKTIMHQQHISLDIPPCGRQYRVRMHIATWIIACLLSSAVSAATCSGSTTPRNSLRAIELSRSGSSEKISVSLAEAVSIRYSFLDRSRKNGRPYRLYIDFMDTRKPPGLTWPRHPANSVINCIRIAQKDANTTRIVFDLKKKLFLEDYHIAVDDAPPAVSITFFPQKTKRFPDTNKNASSDSQPVSEPPGTQPSVSVSAHKAPLEPAAEAAPSPASAVASPSGPDAAMASPGSRKSEETSSQDSRSMVIIIDPGHGGKDPGAIGHNGIMEKDVCFAIALELLKLFDEHSNYTTLMTRHDDIFVSLEDRAKFANLNKADLFISLHANAHRDRHLTGIETYYLSFSSDDEARRVAARENFTTPGHISDLELILFDLLQSDKINKSSIFAGYMQNALVHNLSKGLPHLRNLGVKHAPMRVLIDIDMPGILIETAFISNPVEAKRLQNPLYQKRIATGILEGLYDFNAGTLTAQRK